MSVLTPDPTEIADASVEDAPQHLNILSGLALCLAYGSFLVWFRVLQRRRRGEAALAYREREPTGWSAMLAWGAFLCAFVVPIVLFSIVGTTGRSAIESIKTACLGMSLQILVAIVAVCLVAPQQGLLKALGFKTQNLRSDLKIGGLGFLASLIPVYAINMAVEMLHWRTPEGKHQFLKLLEDDPSAIVVGWITLSVVILAPLTEEFLYRVLLQGGMETIMPARQAIMIVAALFAAAHAGTGKPDYLPLFPLALILGYVYNRLHSYVAVVTVHALFNGMNLMFALLSK